MKGHGILFVHGAFHGAWCWDAVLERVQSPQVVCRCVDLYRGGLEEDVAAVREESEALASEGLAVVVVGHSLGCTSVSQLEPEGIGHVVYLAGPVTGPGMPDLEQGIAPRFLETVRTGDDGVMRIEAETAREFFYHDCGIELTDWAVSQLRPNLAYGPAPLTGQALHEAIRSTYLWCDEDRAVLPAYQREVARHMRYSEGFATSHSPMLSAPDEVAAALYRVVERTPLSG